MPNTQSTALDSCMEVTGTSFGRCQLQMTFQSTARALLISLNVRLDRRTGSCCAFFVRAPAGTVKSESSFYPTMNSILITGCNRGIGLGMIKALVQLPKVPKHIFATCRNKQQAEELQKLADLNSNVHILEIDLRNFNLYETLIKEIDEITREEGLNVLFNNAGIAPKSTRINGVKEQDLTDTLLTNTVVPIMLAKACLPLLKKASKAQESLDLSVQRAAIINMSSSLASISGNTDGGLYAYRTSKAALNAATKSLSIDLLPYKILCVAVHPGWVRTGMGGPNAPLDIHTSATKLIDTILSFNASHNGGFYQYDGEKLSW